MSLASERSWQIQFYVCGNCFSFLLHTFFTTYVTNFLSVLFLGVPERFHWNELSFVKQLYLRNSYTYNFLALKRVYFCVKSYATYDKSRPCENSLADLYTFAFEDCTWNPGIYYTIICCVAFYTKVTLFKARKLYV